MVVTHIVFLYVNISSGNVTFKGYTINVGVLYIIWTSLKLGFRKLQSVWGGLIFLLGGSGPVPAVQFLRFWEV